MLLLKELAHRKREEYKWPIGYNYLQILFSLHY